MKIPCTGIILSGGKGNRFGSENKAFSKIGPTRIIDRIYSIFNKMFDDVVIVTNSPKDYTDFDCLIVTDHYSVRSSLNGIHAGLFASSTHYSFFVACDIPFINQQLAKFMINQIDVNKDIIIPKTLRGFEPIFAIYSKNCLKHIENQINEGNFQIKKLLNKVHVKMISEPAIKKFDPNLISFFNVNSLSDLLEARNYFKSTKFQD